MRCQFVLDGRTKRLLEELASSRAGNRSYVVREAIRLYASLESALDEIETDSRFQRMMARSTADIRAGRVQTHAEVTKRFRTAKRKR
jgi:predicted transcriptional regulator